MEVQAEPRAPKNKQTKATQTKQDKTKKTNAAHIVPIPLRDKHLPACPLQYPLP
jgi:hypothetical protein